MRTSAARSSALFVAPFLLLPFSLNAQQRKPAATELPHSSSLPVTHVSLYKNGVGFFEHTGHVSGDAAVTIDFTSSQLNDVLQSLTAIDLNGGHISGAGYNSTMPLEEQLKTLPLSLDTNPNAADFYSAIRGARVEVHSAGVSILGRLLSVEVRTTPIKDSEDGKAADRYFLTVVADSGEVRTLEITAATSVRLVDTSLHNDVSRYLQLLDSTRSQGLRHLTLEDRGAGSRELRVSYISEVPIWKSTYRILFTDSTNSSSHQATLQGWSVVDNTTGTDWNNVQLSLIAGAPQSFIQPLSQPIYSRRPEIPIAQQAQLTPQTFDSNIDADKLENLTVAGRNSSLHGAGVAGGFMGGIAGGTGTGPRASSVALGGVALGSGMPGGIGRSANETVEVSAGYATMAPVAPPSYQDMVVASTVPNTSTAGFDDFFAYNLTEPITIRKNESALVPILQSKVGADPVTLLSYRNGIVSQPLRALWVTNTSGLTLDRGSFTIIEDGNFAGQGLLEPIHPDEKRLLSYAADQAVHAAAQNDTNSNRVTLIRGSRGVVNIHRAEVHDVTLVLHNAAPVARTVVSEVPVIGGWTLNGATEPASSDPKPVETTPTVYRFRTELAPGETARLHIGASHSGYSTFYLTRSDDNQITFLLNETSHNPAFEAALQPIIAARAHVAEAQTAVDQTRARLDALRSDEDRQRANITALATADKASRDRFVHDLNQTEDKITAAQTELGTRNAALEAAKATLAAAIENFNIDEKV